MSYSDKNAVLVCPHCRKTERTTLDPDEPQAAAVVELPCPACLDFDESRSIEPIFKDSAGVRIFS